MRTVRFGILASLLILIPDIGGAGFQAETYVFPVVARNAGAAGSDWRTEMCVTNHLASDPLNVGVLLIQGQLDGAAILALQPGETICSDDFLNDWFDRSKWQGAAVVLATEDTNPGLQSRYFTASVRVYNLTPNGTYGLSVTPEPNLSPMYDDAFDRTGNWDASGVHHFGTPGVDGSRSSMGVFNSEEFDLLFLFAVTDTFGNIVWTKTRWVNALAQYQTNLPKNLSVPDGGLRVEIIDGGPDGWQFLAFPYLTVTDNKTGDGRYIAASETWTLDAKAGSSNLGLSNSVEALAPRDASDAVVIRTR